MVILLMASGIESSPSNQPLMMFGPLDGDAIRDTLRSMTLIACYWVPFIPTGS